MTPPTRLGTLRLMTTRFWTKMKLILLNALCRLMRFARNLWRPLKLVALKCLRKIGYKSRRRAQRREIITLRLTLRVLKKSIKNVRKILNLMKQRLPLYNVNEQGWYIENIIHGRGDLNETAMKIFQAVRDYRPVSVGIERGIAKQAVMSPLLDLQKKYGTRFPRRRANTRQQKQDRSGYVGASRPF